MQARMHLPPVVIFTSGKGPHPLPHLFTPFSTAPLNTMDVDVNGGLEPGFELFIDKIPQRHGEVPVRRLLSI